MSDEQREALFEVVERALATMPVPDPDIADAMTRLLVETAAIDQVVGALVDTVVELGMVCDAYGLPRSAVALARHLGNNAEMTIGMWKLTAEELEKQRDHVQAQLDVVGDVMEKTDWTSWDDSEQFLVRLQSALDTVVGEGRPVYHHEDGRSCVQDENGDWFVPMDTGGDGFYCERQHPS